jgi:hypothetical protein
MKIRNGLFLALAFVSGFATAAYWFTSLSDETEHRLKIRGLQDMADITRRSLEGMRSGNTNTLQFLEGEYDATIAVLGRDLIETPQKKWNQGVLTTLELAKNYRAKFPRKSGMPDIDQKVSEAFSLVDSGQK